MSARGASLVFLHLARSSLPEGFYQNGLKVVGSRPLLHASNEIR
jgi:hypothetical protein